MTEYHNTVTDITGVKLTPHHPEICEGNGKHVDESGKPIECCCDECDFLIGCLEADKERGTCP